MDVTLEPITRDNVVAVCKLQVHEFQNRLVAPMAISIAESHYYPGSLLRAISADGEPVGLIWVEFEHAKKPYLVRLSVTADRQGQGIGARAMALLEQDLRAAGHTELELSFLPVDDGPRGFYEKLGFSDTGRTIQDEVIWCKAL